MSTSSQPPASSTLSFENWMTWQEGKAWKGLLANIHPEGAAEGCVVASPSKVLPNYWCTCSVSFEKEELISCASKINGLGTLLSS